MKNKTLIITIAILIFAMSSVAQVNGTYTDARDGKTYKTVTIGSQTWMAENLAYKTNKCWALDNDSTNVAKYGYLYRWETAKAICPAGWHLPSQVEWFTLIAFLGDNKSWDKKTVEIIQADGIYYQVNGSKDAGGKAKSPDLWLAPNTDASNSSGFSAIPSGWLGNNGGYFLKGKEAAFWSSEEYMMNLNQKFVMCFVLDYNKASFLGNAVNFTYDSSTGCAVRCIKN